jgi:hypothetical protein
MAKQYRNIMRTNKPSNQIHMKLVFALICVLAVATSASTSSAVFVIGNDMVYAQDNDEQGNDGDKRNTAAIEGNPEKPQESKDAAAAATLGQSSSPSSSSPQPSISDDTAKAREDANVNGNGNENKGETKDGSKAMPSTATGKTPMLDCNVNELTAGNGGSMDLCSSLQPAIKKEEQGVDQPTTVVINGTQDKSNNSTENGDNEKTAAGPDRDCLFDPSLPKCVAVDGKCPEGFNQNGYGQCVPEGGCPKGYHTVDDDETGRCIPNSDGCPSDMIFRPDKKTCGYKSDVCKTYPQLKECKAEDNGPSSIKIKTDQKTYKLGQTVKITVTNTGNKTVKFPDSALGLTIKSQSTGEVYRLIAAQAITELKPGDSKIVEWKQQDNGGKQVKPGAYSAMVSAGSLRAKTDFSIASTEPKGPNAGKFIVHVQVTNNGPSDEKGGVYVSIDGTDISKSLHGVTFPSKKTITKTFEFDSRDVPVGKKFTAEVVYGDDYDEQASGVNSPANTPETVRIYIGPYSAEDRLKFKLNVQVTNNKATDDRGQILAHIDGTNLYKSLDNVVFPSKKTITKTFEFNSRDVPVGRGYTVSVEPASSPSETVHGVNSPAKTPETARVTIR